MTTAIAAAARTPPPLRQPGFPIRGAFYYGWYPEAWRQQGKYPFTVYAPTLGYYSSASQAVIRRHLAELRWAHVQLGISSWWGRGNKTDVRLGEILAVTAAARVPVWWSVYYEPEGQGDPSVEQIRSDLAYIKQRYGRRQSYLRVGGRFVVFVYADARDGCAMAQRWHAANTVGAYVVLKVFPGYRSCPDQPEGWHQYGPAGAASDQRPYSYSISPGFAKATEPSPRLVRDPARWQAEVRDMIASRARFQLITTFNEWGEGTAVEPAREWASPSGYGTYLDALHANGGAPATTSPTTTVTAPGRDPTVAAAGDIACDPTSSSFNGGNGTAQSCHQLATSSLVLQLHPTAVLTLGDTQYEDNQYSKYLQSFDPSWGRLRPIIHPTVGNHEYLTQGAAGYFQYFGAAAGDPHQGYYSFDLGAWHLISLNSECSHAGGCGAGSPQETWLRADLAAHHAGCTLAYWHEPRFSSGEHGDNQGLATIWNDLVAAHVDLVLTGHNHDYERFDPLGATPQQNGAEYQSPNLDPNGIRTFVVGTGGKNHYDFTAPPLAGEVVRNSDTYGVLLLSLHPTGYDWRFVPEAGKTFTDSGSGSCH